jgi:hypothetical protein
MFDGTGWYNKLAGSFAQVSCRHQGEMIGVTPSDEILWGDGTTWTRLAGSLQNVSIGEDGEIWGCDRSGDIWRWGSPGWEKIPGELQMISVHNQHCIVGVNSKGNIYSWEGTWRRVDGELKCVSAGLRLWGCNFEGTVWSK